MAGTLSVPLPSFLTADEAVGVVESAACEPDHTTEWQNGGTTNPRNLAMLCPRHHALKSIGAWTYTQIHPNREPAMAIPTRPGTRYGTSRLPHTPPPR